MEQIIADVDMPILDTADDHVVNIQPADVQMVNTAQGDVERVQFPPATVAIIGIH